MLSADHQPSRRAASGARGVPRPVRAVRHPARYPRRPAVRSRASALGSDHAGRRSAPPRRARASSVPAWAGRRVLDTLLGRGRIEGADDLIAEMIESPTLVFLKQFRDASCPTKACYQAIVEAPLAVHLSTAQLQGARSAGVHDHGRGVGEPSDRQRARPRCRGRRWRPSSPSARSSTSTSSSASRSGGRPRERARSLMAKPRIAILGGGAGAVTAALRAVQAGLGRPLRVDHPLPAGLAPGRQGSLRARPRPAHRGARPAPLVRLLRERVPAARPLSPRARPARETTDSPAGTWRSQNVEDSFSPLERARGHRPRRVRVEPVGGGLLRRRRGPSVARVRPASPGRAPGPVDGRLLRRALSATGGRPRMVPGRVRPGAGEDPPGRRGGPRDASQSSTTRSTSRWRRSGATSGRRSTPPPTCSMRSSRRPWTSPLVLGALGIVVRAARPRPATSCAAASTSEARASPSIRRAYYVVDLMVAIVRGRHRGRRDRAGQLRRRRRRRLSRLAAAHGALRETADCALVRAIVYDLGFAYEGGDPQRPSCEAGTALRGLLRAFFTYRGSLMWRMNSGMGDVVFLPFYELLIKRGVEVSFFHRVEELRAANGVIEEIEIDVQADVPSDTPPEAYVTVDSRPTAGRGSSPGRRIRTRSSEAPATRPRPTSPGTSVGTPPGSTPRSCAAGPPTGSTWSSSGCRSAACRNVAPRPGRAARRGGSGRWTISGPSRPRRCSSGSSKPASKLAEVDDGIVVSGYVEPFDTWADMSQLRRPGEGERLRHGRLLLQRAGRRAAAACAATRHSGSTDQKALVRAQALRFLTKDIGGAVARGGRPRHRPVRLGPAGGAGGGDGSRTASSAQYLRANVEPSERYVLSVPGSGEHRIAPDDTGFSNLYAVGDWTACGSTPAAWRRRSFLGCWPRTRSTGLTGTRPTPSRSSGSRARRRRKTMALTTANHGDGRSTRCMDVAAEGVRRRLAGRRVRRRRAGREPSPAAAGRERRGEARRRARSRRRRSADAARDARRAASSPPGTGSGADLIVELLERFGEAVQEIAGHHRRARWFDGEPECPTLELEGAPGQRRRSSSTSRTPAPRR